MAGCGYQNRLISGLAVSIQVQDGPISGLAVSIQVPDGPWLWMMNLTCIMLSILTPALKEQRKLCLPLKPEDIWFSLTQATTLDPGITQW